MHASELLDSNKINELVNLDLADAQANAISMMSAPNFKIKAAKKAQLIEDIKNARRSSEVCRIMYYTYLAGEGLSVVGSKWQEKYKSAK